MKILFVSTNDWVPWGGSEELWYKTALFLKKQGYEVYVSVKKWKETPVHIVLLQDAGCIIHYRTTAEPIPFFIRVVKRLFNKQKNIFSLLDEIKPKIVLINQGSIADGLDWGEACIIRKINYLYLVQLVNELSVWNDEFICRLIKIFSAAKAIFFVSSQNLSLFQSITGYQIKNSIVIRNPSKSSEIIPYPSQVVKNFNIAFVASLNSFHKGHDMLFEIMRSEKWKSRNLTINLYGKGPNEKTLKRLKELYSLQNIIFAGFENDIKKIYATNHAFILCSRMEGQSLALIEAMYCGRIPIVTNVGGAEELIEDGKSGFISKSSSIQDIDINLERAWLKKDEWKELGENAATTIRNIIKENPVEIFSQKIIDIINAS